MTYEITDKCFFSLKEKQLNKCGSFLLSSLPSPPRSLPLLGFVSLRGRAQQHLWSGNEQAVLQIKMRPWVSSGSCCPPKPPSAPPSQVLGLCQRTSQAGWKGKKGERESLLLHPAQALWGCWYSWYVMSFSWVLAGREQGDRRGSHAHCSVQDWPCDQY